MAELLLHVTQKQYGRFWEDSAQAGPHRCHVPEDARFEFSFRPWAGEPWSLPPLAVRLRGSKTRSLFGLVARPLAELPKLGVAQLCPAPILTNPQALLLCLKL